MSELILVECAWAERADVASWLVETAKDMGIDVRLIQTRNEGFLAPKKLVYGEDKPVERPPGASTTVPELPEPGVVIPIDREKVRAWAKENGYDVADRGKLKQSVLDAFTAAQA